MQNQDTPAPPDGSFWEAGVSSSHRDTVPQRGRAALWALSSPPRNCPGGVWGADSGDGVKLGIEAGAWKNTVAVVPNPTVHPNNPGAVNAEPTE